MMVEADERSRVEQSVQRIPNCNLPSGSQEYSTDILPSKSRGTRQSRGFGVLGKGRTEPSVRVQRQYDLHAHTCHASVQASYNAAPGSATICVDWCVCVSVCVRACMRAARMAAHTLACVSVRARTGLRVELGLPRRLPEAVGRPQTDLVLLPVSGDLPANRTK
jgi:hypothetical protein